jgi:hypothetical protein
MAALLLLLISEDIRETRWFKRGIRRFVGDRKPWFDGFPKVLSGEISSSSDPTAWRRLGKINRGETERGFKGIYRQRREPNEEVIWVK